MREIFSEVIWERKVFAFVVSTILLTVVGPFGTYEDLPFVERFIFWVAVLAGVGVFMHAMFTVFLAAAWLRPVNRQLRILLGAAVAAIPGTAVVVFINAVFRPPLLEGSNLPLMWFQVTVIGTVIGFVEYRAPRPVAVADPAGPVGPAPPAAPPDPAESDPAPRAAGPVRTRLHERLPDREDGTPAEIVSVSMQDHYAEVMTAEGPQLLLMRLTDAIAELDGIEGVRLHRSHWAAARHVERVEKRGNRHMARLSDGRELAVSATYLDAAKAAAG